MDPIEHIAHVFTLYCREHVQKFMEIQRIVDEHDTVGEAVTVLAGRNLLPSADPDHLKFIDVDLPRLKRCLVRMKDIKTMARYVFQSNFTEEEKLFVFSQEISFSYAAKMLVSMGLQHAHFSNSPTKAEVMKAELAMAMRTPVSIFNEELVTPPSSPKVSHPGITKRRSGPVGSKKAASIQKPRHRRISDLLCSESMDATTTKQTRPPLPPPPTPCGRS